MDIPKVLSSAAKIKATEARVEVGEPTLLVVRGEIRTLFGSTVKAADFEDGVVRRMDAFKREELRTTGRCQWQFEESGIGKIQAEIEKTSARFLLPETVEVRPAPKAAAKLAPGESKPGFLGKLFGK